MDNLHFNVRALARITAETPEAATYLRLLGKTTPGPGGCVVWTGAVDANNYGRFSGGGKTLYAHRAAYEVIIGPIPAGLVLDHLCRMPRCINPHHLEPVTQAENIRRGAQAQKTHCTNGHVFTEANTRLRSSGNGKRDCRTCNRERKAGDRR